MSLLLNATVAPKTGFASHQNSVPLLRDLELENQGAEALDDLELDLQADPPFIEPKKWRIDRVLPGTVLHISDRDVKLQAGFLLELPESISGTLTLTARQGEAVLAQTSHPVELLSKNHWGGCAGMPELLPAFCMPNDPTVDRLLKSASDVLRRSGKPDGINGYETKSRSRVWELASALWSAVAGLELSYALPPAGFEESGQKIRTPGAILDGRVATCLDTALLFAAGLEQAGLNPVLVITKGHAFTGVWLQPQEFSQLITDEAAAVRKRIELQELVVFETTLVAQRPVAAFSRAVEQGRRQLTDEDFVMVIDIRRARMQRIRPLGVGDRPAALQADLPAQPVSEALEEAPNLPAFDVEVTPENLTAAGRVEMWQRKLLDLTTRNRLLHLPESSKCVPLLCQEPAILEDMIASGKKITVAAMPAFETMGRDTALYERQNLEQLQEKYARDAMDRGEVVSTLPQEKLDVEVVDLYRKARLDMDEGGANTLFLAAGFLRWKKTATDPRTYRAPLILIPVQLERRSALSKVTLRMHEDEPRFNLTLLELLRQDFELRIPALEGPLPQDENGVDVARVWNTMRVAVRDIPGFEVTSDLVLGTFSFAKYLMWKDLVDRREMLVQSPVVKHLIERASEGFGGREDFPKPERLDHEVAPAELFTPLPADSSQLAAVVASAKGCNFVLDGPPGTGKSQTIANMIAHNLAHGRRVLFVAEKMAALQVVHRRLSAIGLGEFCLELHSNKTSKAETLKHLERAWDARESAAKAGAWHASAEEARRLRDRLNQVVAVLHQRRSNGMTAHQAIGLVVRDWHEALPRLAWAAGSKHTEDDMARLRAAVRRLDQHAAAMSSRPAAFALIAQKEWSNGWQEALVAAAVTLKDKAAALTSTTEEWLKAARLPVQVATLADSKRLLACSEEVLATHGLDLAFAFAPDAPAKISAAREALPLVAEYLRVEASLSVKFAAGSAQRMDLQKLDADWEAASGKFWFLATMAKKKVAESVARQGGTTGLPDVAADLPKLHRLAQLSEQLDRLGAQMAGVPGWQHVDTDTARLEKVLAAAERLRAAVPPLAASPEHLAGLRAAVKTLVVDANELLAPDGSLAAACRRMKEGLTAFENALEPFAHLSGTPDLAGQTVAALQESAAGIQAAQTRLQAWCQWNRAREDAVSLQLMPLVAALESGAVPSGSAVTTFETAYARWFAAETIDSEPCLREFTATEHVDDIEDFRKISDKLSKLSVDYIRAKICGEIPPKDGVGKKDGFGVLRGELQKQRRHKPLRQLASEMGDALTRLAPCMLMSPLSIAQFLPPEQALFDLVIFDEASQITPWDAVGSMARGRQVIIAGDPRQMPPTSFFNRSATDAAVDDDDVEEDMASILDECLAAGIPSHSLTWHYRSRHESLIAFSNHRYYESNLITFPSAVTRASEVKWQRVPGVYAKGKTRTNQAEAEQMVAEAVRRLKDPAFGGAGRTLGIVTLNAEQQKLVEDLLDKERQRHPELERFFSTDNTEPVVVKNLETVQGDERDLIMLGIGYGPTEPGSPTMSMNFGPLNRDGGWRRLNVAVTRARQEMMVFSSFDPAMVDLNRTSARAVRDLKHFLEFAERGPQALGEAVRGSLGGHDSPFEAAVSRRLMDLGWQVVPQIGVSRFRIDLGVVHPDKPGNYLVGVECDGATYHSAATARDRDKVRAAILEGLGWKLLRVWSTEWWVDKEGAVRQLHTAIQGLLERSRAEALEAASAPPPQPPNATPEPTTEAPEAAETTTVADSETTDDQDEADVADASAGLLARAPTPDAGKYRAAEFGKFAMMLQPGLFHDSKYDPTLTELIRHVIETEAPVAEGLLVQRIARAHGFQKSTRVIRERVLDVVEEHFHLREDPLGGRFVWPHKDAAGLWATYRPPATQEDLRMIEDISFEELKACIVQLPGGDSSAVETARRFGIRRLVGANKERLEAALQLAGKATPDRAP